MYQLVVLLTAGTGGVAGLRAFEKQTLPILKSHGGTLVTAFTPDATGHEHAPDEIHVIRFPSKKAFESYRRDPRILELSEERRAAIASTVVYASAGVVDYDLG